MIDNDCIFCRIADHSATADIKYEDDDVVVFQDILPKAPVHLLVIPKTHIQSVTDLQPAQADLVGKMVMTAKQVAEKQGIAETGYKLIFNVGKHGGQIVKHIHLHMLGGKQLPE